MVAALARPSHGAEARGGTKPPVAEPRAVAEPRVEALRAEGIAHYKERRYFQAIKAFEDALALVDSSRAPEFKELLARTRSALGVELFSSGEIRQASECFREAIAEAPDAYAHFGLGFVHYVRLEDALAQEELNEALRLEPTYPKTHKLLALLDYRQGKTADALSTMEKAFALDAKDNETKALLERWKTELEVTKSFLERSEGGLTIRADPVLPSARVEDTSRRLARTRKEIWEAFQLESRTRVVVVLFSPERFYKATKSFHWVGGFYDGQIKLPLEGGSAPSAEDLERLGEALRHELTHVVVRQVCSECPNWLNEGIAQHFERPGRGPGTALELRAKAGRRIRFQDVPVRLWEVDDEELARMTYLQGLSFVEFLVERFGEFRLRLVLESIHREGSLRRGFELTYGLALGEAEALWWNTVEAKPGSATSAGPAIPEASRNLESPRSPAVPQSAGVDSR